MNAEQPCPACKRGDHEDCWGVEPPPTVAPNTCPCKHLSQPGVEAIGEGDCPRCGRIAEIRDRPCIDCHVEQMERYGVAYEVVDEDALTDRLLGR